MISWVFIFTKATIEPAILFVSRDDLQTARPALKSGIVQRPESRKQKLVGSREEPVYPSIIQPNGRSFCLTPTTKKRGLKAKTCSLQSRKSPTLAGGCQPYISGGLPKFYHASISFPPRQRKCILKVSHQKVTITLPCRTDARTRGAREKTP